MQKKLCESFKLRKLVVMRPKTCKSQNGVRKACETKFLGFAEPNKKEEKMDDDSNVNESVYLMSRESFKI